MISPAGGTLADGDFPCPSRWTHWKLQVWLWILGPQLGALLPREAITITMCLFSRGLEMEGKVSGGLWERESTSLMQQKGLPKTTPQYKGADSCSGLN